MLNSSFYEAKRPSLIYWLILIYSLWNSRTLLLEAWARAPTERWGWLIFLLWTIPFWIQLFKPLPRILPASQALAICALILQVTGDIGDMNLLHYLGLVTAFGAMMPCNALTFYWMATGFAWMPAFGWIAVHYLSFSPILLRFGIALSGVIFWCLWRFKEINQKEA